MKWMDDCARVEFAKMALAEQLEWRWRKLMDVMLERCPDGNVVVYMFRHS